MAISDQELVDVILQGESTGARFLVPFKINTCVFLPLPVSSDHIVFLKLFEEMLCVFLDSIFNAKSSTFRQNMTGRHLCSQSPGVVAAS